MHVITYSTNFAPPHFAAGGIPKNTPHGTMEDHTAYIYILSIYPFWMEFFSFSCYTKHTLLRGLIVFVTYGKGEGMQFRWANFSSCLYAVDAIIVIVFFILPGLESQRSLGTNFFILNMYFVWNARSLQFHVVKHSHAFNMVWPLAANR